MKRRTMEVLFNIKMPSYAVIHPVFYNLKKVMKTQPKVFTQIKLDEFISEFIKAMKENGFDVDRSILFGSYAIGNPHKFSDIDLAVWLKNDIQKHFSDDPKLLHIVSSFHPIKPIFYNKDESSATDPFIEVIESTGKIINLVI